MSEELLIILGSFEFSLLKLTFIYILTLGFWELWLTQELLRWILLLMFETIWKVEKLNHFWNRIASNSNFKLYPIWFSVIVYLTSSYRKTVLFAKKCSQLGIKGGHTLGPSLHKDLVDQMDGQNRSMPGVVWLNGRLFAQHGWGIKLDL